MNGEAAIGAPTIFVGDRLGLFKAMAGAGELTPEELAKRTATHPRMIKEWLVRLQEVLSHITQLIVHTLFQMNTLLLSQMIIVLHT